MQIVIPTLIRCVYSHPTNSHKLYSNAYCSTSPLKCVSSESALFVYVCWILCGLSTFSTFSYGLSCPFFIIYTDRRGDKKSRTTRYVQHGHYVIPWASKLSFRHSIHKSWSKEEHTTWGLWMMQCGEVRCRMTLPLVTGKIRGKTKWIFMFLTLSNPIFLPPAYSPAHICFGRERGWWITCNYPTVLKEQNINRNIKSTTCAICWLKSVLHEEKRRQQENHNVGFSCSRRFSSCSTDFSQQIAQVVLFMFLFMFCSFKTVG
jgi:hypothetical protein